jgi:mannose-6-phosphate isomerase
MQQLSCAVMSYEWGKLGAASAVASLHAAATGEAPDAARPYAEYWFGTHPSGPSALAHTGEALQAHLLARPAALGVAPYAPGSALPFLLKVLSVGKALSVQAHPDAALAARLHAARPDVYRDGNHKPEMAVALTPFDAMCSFRAPRDAAAQLARAPELLALAGAAASAALLAAGAAGDAGAYAAALRPWYAALMAAEPAAVAGACAALGARVGGGGSGDAELPACAAGAGAPALPAGVAALDADAVAARLLAQYPGDVGVFAPYFLNTLRLAPGTALFLGAGEPHAYLAGDCVEVMACSDNVVRAGLTPKMKDAPTLLAMLTYDVSGAPAIVPPRAAAEPFTTHFAAPVPEFGLDAVRVPAGGATRLRAGPSAAIVLVLSGAAAAASPGAPPVALREGTVWLQPADAEVTVAAAADLVLFRAAAARA